MNTRIARRLNDARRNPNPEKSINEHANEVTASHNLACGCGFLDLPALEYVDAEVNDKAILVHVAPRSGMITANDLYNLKTAWGADELNVLVSSKSIELTFKKQ